MEEVYAACLVYEPGLFDFADFKRSSDPVWILGKKYNTLDDDDLEKLHDKVKSIFWFTYRKQFPPLGDASFTTDTGWGCMHRCGQMVMAQALITKQLGQDWVWKETESNEDFHYVNIRNKFNDNDECIFSVHKLASQGDVLEKKIGEWFGPNTIAQILKKISLEDSSNDIAIHVALDNMVIRKEIMKTCREIASRKISSCHSEESCHSSKQQRETVSGDAICNSSDDGFSPLLLIIPLRLGLSDIIPNYFEKLKAVFTFSQCVGIIGGRTNHASYFIGYVGDLLIYLDPHTTQVYSPEMADSTYHCRYPGQMSFKQLDPSIALCFFCKDQKDFEDWCAMAEKVLLHPESDALFEILEDKLPLIPYSDDSDDIHNAGFSAGEFEQNYTSDNEFELL